MSFTFTPLAIPEVVLVQPRVFRDTRGCFIQTYQASAFRAAGLDADFVQDNRSVSRRGVLRGLHYQLPPFAQGKLVSVSLGSIWDVAVDVRQGSATFGKWVGLELTAESGSLLWIPPGFAHGFVVLSEEAHFVYKCTAEYAPAAERGFRWNDPALAIDWPLRDVTVSARDAALPRLAEVELP